MTLWLVFRELSALNIRIILLIILLLIAIGDAIEFEVGFVGLDTVCLLTLWFRFVLCFWMMSLVPVVVVMLRVVARLVECYLLVLVHVVFVKSV